MRKHNLPMKECSCCSGNRLQAYVTIPDNSGKPTNIWQCLDCYCFIPDYSIKGKGNAYNLDQQIKFHEAYWAEENTQSMDNLRLELGYMVDMFGEYLGKALDRDFLFDIGADAVGLFIPGGNIAVKTAKKIMDSKKKK